jgi:hypothetical protein
LPSAGRDSGRREVINCAVAGLADGKRPPGERAGLIHRGHGVVVEVGIVGEGRIVTPGNGREQTSISALHSKRFTE